MQLARWFKGTRCEAAVVLPPFLLEEINLRSSVHTSTQQPRQLHLPELDRKTLVSSR
jgi:hypothetical protein